jgi:7,8-dihydropterin-6-yl-methyl-4-(beta-D-ribofuranosyl)aminobenzene 5'-phosphate synthase
MTSLSSLFLQEVDRVEITTLIDNYVDLMLQDTHLVKRPPLSKGTELPRETLAAEHGLSLLVTTYRGSEKNSVLFDAGYNKNGVLHNIDQLGLDIQSVEAIVLSHAHMDHAGALYSILNRISKPVALVVHPDIFSFPRFLEDKAGNRVFFPRTLLKEDIAATDLTLIESRSPTLIAHDTIAVTGEVERTTEFEKGMPNAYVEVDGHRQNDRIADDQSLVVQLKNNRLVLITGCCHAGIINTIRFVRKLTGIEKVYGVLGGFHLSGAFFETVIDRTVEALKEIHPEVIVPMHCTGWNAVKKLADALPDSFIINSVGSRFILT